MLSWVEHEKSFITSGPDIFILPDAGVPDEYLCPITREIMKDPVIVIGKSMILFVWFDSLGPINNLSVR